MGGCTCRYFSRRLFGLLSVLVAAVAIAACGGGDDDDDSGGGGGGTSEAAPAGSDGRRGDVQLPLVPGLPRPGAGYTQAGWQALWTVYTPLRPTSTRRARRARAHPGPRRGAAEVSEDGKTYTFKLRKGLKYSDGSAVKASDFEHAIKRVLTLESGGSSFFTGTIDGAEEYLKAGKAKGDISGIKADDATGEITIKLTAPTASSRTSWRCPSRPRSGRHAVRGPDQEPPPGVGPFKIT